MSDLVEIKRESPTLYLPLLMYKESKVNGEKKTHYVVPTWNHIYKVGNRRIYMDKWAKLYKQNITILTKEWIKKHSWRKTQDRKVFVDVVIYFHDAIRRDCSNLDKLFLDAFEDAGIYDDDMNALVRFQDFGIDIDNPRIEVNFIVGEKFNRKEEVQRQKKLKKKKEKEMEKTAEN